MINFKRLSTKLIFALGFAWSLSVASAELFVLTMHVNDGMGSSGSKVCDSLSHCIDLSKSLEYRMIDDACFMIEITQAGELVYMKRYIKRI